MRIIHKTKSERMSKNKNHLCHTCHYRDVCFKSAKKNICIDCKCYTKKSKTKLNKVWKLCYGKNRKEGY